MKWKLILVATLGAIGLGLNNTQLVVAENEKIVELPIQISSYLILCFIPLVCVYVDSLCQHLYLRVLVIGVFFRQYHYRDSSEIDWFREYERFCEMSRTEEMPSKNQISVGERVKNILWRKNKAIRPFSLEDLAMEGATVIFSLLVLVVAFYLWYVTLDSNCPIFIDEKPYSECPNIQLISILIGLSSIFGIALSLHVKYQFKKKSEWLSANADVFIQKIVQERIAVSRRVGVV